MLVELYDAAWGRLELPEGVLQLLVEDTPVGDDDDAGEDLPVLGVEQVGHAVRCPADRVGLTRPGRVLDKVRSAYSLPQRRPKQRVDRVDLVVTREQQHGRERFLACPEVGRFLDLDGDELAQDVEEDFPGQNVVPEIGGGVPPGDVRRVARAGAALAVLDALVERQESGLRAFQLGGHAHLVAGQREEHQGTAPERK